MADPNEGVVENPLESLSQQEYEHYRRSGEMPTPADATTSPDLPPADATPAEDTPDPGTGEPDDDNPAEFTKRGLSKRFRQITQARREAEARVAALEQQLSRLEQQGSRPVNNAVQQPTGAPGEPRQEDFETVGEWYAALIDSRVEQRLQRERQAATEYVQRQQIQKAQADWEAKLEIARAKHEDYDEVVDAIDVPQTPAVPAIIDAIRQSDAGTEISYYLAKNPKELARLAELSPTRAVAEVGKIEARLTAAPAPAARVSNAPRPPALAAGTARTDVSIFDEELSFPDYVRLRAEQIKRNQY